MLSAKYGSTLYNYYKLGEKFTNYYMYFQNDSSYPFNSGTIIIFNL